MNFQSFAKKYQQEANGNGFELTLDQAKKMCRDLYETGNESIDNYKAQQTKYTKLIKKCETVLDGVLKSVVDIQQQIKDRLLRGAEADDLLEKIDENAQNSTQTKAKLEQEQKQIEDSLIKAQENLITKSLVGVAAPMERPNVADTKQRPKSATPSKMKVSYMYSFAQSQMARDYMEDYIATIPSNTGFLLSIVCDGHGGTLAAKWVSGQFPRRMKQIMISENLPLGTQLLQTTLTSLVDDWDNNNKTNLEFGADSSGTTICISILDRITQKLYVLNLGDSRLTVFDSSTEDVVFATKDHSLDDPKEVTRIEKLKLKRAPHQKCQVLTDGHGTRRVQGNIAMSRAFGDNLLDMVGCLSRTPDLYTFQLKAPYNYFIVMGSDGLYDDLSNLEMKRLLYDGQLKDAKTFTNKIKSKRLQDPNFGSDNASVILIKTYTDA